MNETEIERALRDEPEISPTPDFAHRVMRSVRHQAADHEAMPFPWKQLAAGLAASAGLALAGVLAGGASAPAPLPELSGELVNALTWLSTTLVGCLGLGWWSVRHAGR